MLITHSKELLAIRTFNLILVGALHLTPQHDVFFCNAIWRLNDHACSPEISYLAFYQMELLYSNMYTSHIYLLNVDSFQNGLIRIFYKLVPVTTFGSLLQP